MSITNSQSAFNWHEIVNRMSRFPVSRNIVIIFAYLCVNKIAYIIIGETLGTMQTCTNPDQVHCTSVGAVHYSPMHCSALLRGTREPRQGGSEVCTLLQGRNTFCVTHCWKIFPRELRNLTAESLTQITVTENLRHREIKIPCPKPFWKIASEMEMESSSHEWVSNTRLFFFFPLFSLSY